MYIDVILQNCFTWKCNKEDLVVMVKGFIQTVLRLFPDLESVWTMRKLKTDSGSDFLTEISSGTWSRNRSYQNEITFMDWMEASNIFADSSIIFTAKIFSSRRFLKRSLNHGQFARQKRPFITHIHHEQGSRLLVVAKRFFDCWRFWVA